ncbi:MAG: TGS domain-containing protein, partial [Pseudomonadota bacterium]
MADGAPAQVSITLPDGAVRRYQTPVTAADVATDISKSLAKKALACRIDGRLADLSAPIEADTALDIVTAQDETAALELIRHDLAHIMARAVQEIWPETKVTIGPVIEDGFYYDFDRETPFTEEDFPAIEAKMREIIAARDPVRTEVWPRDRAIAHYEAAGEPFKVELVGMIPEGEAVRMYWHGPWQDLCRGPHLAHTGQCPPDAFKLMSVAGAYWRGDNDNKMLQRIYAVAFRSKAELDAWLHQREEALKR